MYSRCTIVSSFLLSYLEWKGFSLITERIRKHNVETFMEFVQSSITKDFGYSDDEVMYSLRETMDKLKVREE